MNTSNPALAIPAMMDITFLWTSRFTASHLVNGTIHSYV
jgi:hypothetical protein